MHFISRFLSLRGQTTYVRPSDLPTAANPNCPDLRGVNERLVFLDSHIITLAEDVSSEWCLSVFNTCVLALERFHVYVLCGRVDVMEFEIVKERNSERY
jgi:hypothetical protein